MSGSVGRALSVARTGSSVKPPNTQEDRPGGNHSSGNESPPIVNNFSDKQHGGDDIPTATHKDYCRHSDAAHKGQQHQYADDSEATGDRFAHAPDDNPKGRRRASE